MMWQHRALSNPSTVGGMNSWFKRHPVNRKTFPSSYWATKSTWNHVQFPQNGHNSGVRRKTTCPTLKHPQKKVSMLRWRFRVLQGLHSASKTQQLICIMSFRIRSGCRTLRNKILAVNHALARFLFCLTKKKKKNVITSDKHGGKQKQND